MSSTCVHEVSDSFRLCSPFYFTHFLSHSFHLFLYLKFVDNLLRTPHKESMDETYLRTGYEHHAYDFKEAQSSWTRRRSSPTKGFTPSTMTLHSRVCFAKLSPSTWPSLSTRRLVCQSVVVVSVRQNGATFWERCDLLCKVARKHRVGLCPTNKQSRFKPSAR